MTRRRRGVPAALAVLASLAAAPAASGIASAQAPARQVAVRQAPAQPVPAQPVPFGAPVLAAAPTGSGSSCSQAEPCDLATALAIAGGDGEATVELEAGTYTSATGFQLSLGPASSGAATVALVGAPSGSVLDGGGAAPVLTLAGQGTVTVSGLTFLAGSSPGNGGGIADAGGPALVVSESAFVDDLAAGDGGGIAVSGGSSLDVSSTTFVGDAAGQSGGAIAEIGAPATVVGSTLVSDRAASGGGIAGDAGARLEADVLAADAGGACAGPVVDDGYVVTDDGSCPPATGSAVVGDAQLFAGGAPSLAQLGGPTEVVPLSLGADPVLEAVPASATLPSSPATFCSTTDARGVPRLQVVPGGTSLATGCSPGAFQVALPTVDRVVPSSPGPGSTVTLAGHGLGLVTAVTVGGRRAALESVSDGSLTASLPSGLPPGPATVVLESPDVTLPDAAAGRATIDVAGPLTIETAGLAPTETGAVYFDHLVAFGGAGGDRWAAAGPMPPGIGVSASGLVSGFPQAAGDFPVSVRVTDSIGVTAQATLTLSVGTGPSIATTSLPAGQVGVPYRARLLASGGRGPYRWSVPSSTQPFPAGLLLSSRGTLTGIPGTPGTTPVTFLVTDRAGGRASVTLPVAVAPPPPPPQAYVVASPDGRVATFGSPALPAGMVARPRGSRRRSVGRIVGVALPAGGGGYWLVGSTGRVVGAGDRRTLGSVGRRYLHGRVAGIASMPAGDGYWVATSTGQVYGFGAAHALGKPADARALGRVVAIVASPAGTGYWLVGATGQVAAFGDAGDFGSIPARLRIHVVGAATDPRGAGYALVSAAGRVFAFGHDRPLGWATRPRAGRFDGIALAPNGLGYWLVTTTGRVVAAGTAEALASPYATVPGGAVAIASAR